MKKTEALFSADAFWSVNKHLAQKIGIIPTVLLSELIWSRKRFKSEEFFINSKELEDTLGIGEDARRSALKKLSDLELITVTAKGVPKRYYYQINDDKLEAILSDTSDQETPTLETQKPRHSRSENPDTIIKKDINNELKKDIDIQKRELLKSDPKAFPKLKANFTYLDLSDWYKDKFKSVDIINHAISRFLEIELKKKPPTKDGPNLWAIYDRLRDDTCPYEQIWEFMYKYMTHDFWSSKMTPTAEYIRKSWDQVDILHLSDWKRYGYSSEVIYRNETKPTERIGFNFMGQRLDAPTITVSEEDRNNFIQSLEDLKT